MKLFEIKKNYEDMGSARTFVAANTVFEALEKYAKSRLWLAEESLQTAKDMASKNFKHEDGSECNEDAKKQYLETIKKDPIQIARENLDVKSIERIGNVIQ